MNDLSPLVAFLLAEAAPLALMLLGLAVAKLLPPSSDPCDILFSLFLGTLTAMVVALAAYLTKLWVAVPFLLLPFLAWGGWISFASAYWKRSGLELTLWLFAVATQTLIFLVATRTSGSSGDLISQVFNLTGVTPGDSPNAFSQAQYLHNFTALTTSVHGFVITDRPIGGGLVTATLLSLVGQVAAPPDQAANETQWAFYGGAWIGLNATGLVALFRVATWIVDRRTALILALGLAASPVMAFMTVGLWPKLLGLTMAVQSIEALGRRRFVSCGASLALAFLLHGSFLCYVIACCAVTGLLIFNKDGFCISVRSYAILVASAFVPIGLWFVFTALSGVDSPLRFYYLYNAGIDERVRSTALHIKQNFYASNIGTFRYLGLVNFLRSMLPFDLLSPMTTSLLPQSSFHPGQLFDGLYLSNVRCFSFVFGLTGCLTALYGVMNGYRRDWRIQAAVAFFLLSYAPAFFLYHRDWSPDVTVAVYGMVPMVVILAAAMASFDAIAKFWLLTFCWAEYSAVLLLRARVPWQGEWDVLLPYLKKPDLALCLLGLYAVALGIVFGYDRLTRPRLQKADLAAAPT